MTDYDPTNSGALFKNDKANNPARPDYKGSINVDGTDYWISSWLKTAKSGQKYMSLSVQRKEEKVQQSGSQEASDMNDAIPSAFGGDADLDVPFANPYQFTYLCV